jgi:hypothetical protein
MKISYVGTKGTHLFRSRNIDTALPKPGTTNSNRPFFGIQPLVTDIEYRGSDGNSIYHALQAEYTTHVSRRLQGRFSYTWSKEIDDLTIFWPYDDKLNRSVGTSASIPSAPQNAIANLVFQLPVGNGQHFLSQATGAKEWLLGNWQVSWIGRINSGAPLVLTMSNSASLNTGTTNRPNQVKGCTGGLRGQHNMYQWFNTSYDPESPVDGNPTNACFTNPSAVPFSLGVEDVGSIRAPGYANLDMNLTKSEKFHDRQSISFKLDAFNVLNHPNLGSPGVRPDGANFGVITSTTGTPRQLQLGVHYTF